VISGFVGAHIARRREFLHAAAAGLPSFLTSLLWYPYLQFYVGSAQRIGIPPWYDAVIYGLLFLIVPGALAGGYLACVGRLSHPEDNSLAQVETRNVFFVYFRDSNIPVTWQRLIYLMLGLAVLFGPSLYRCS